jgi:hypothetical protein
MYICLLSKVPTIPVTYERNLNYLNRVLKNTQTSDFMRVCPIGTQLFHADRQADEWTDMTMLKSAFCNSVKVPKKQ